MELNEKAFAHAIDIFVNEVGDYGPTDNENLTRLVVEAYLDALKLRLSAVDFNKLLEDSATEHTVDGVQVGVVYPEPKAAPTPSGDDGWQDIKDTIFKDRTPSGEPVERYAQDVTLSIKQHPEGEYVRFTDYTALQSRLAEVEGERDYQKRLAFSLGKKRNRTKVLEDGYRQIMKACVAGQVCDDVAWFDNFETLFDFCARMLGNSLSKEEYEALRDDGIDTRTLGDSNG